ncbi:hypothetical protein [Chelatococcus reniformis]|uniref:Uncharacterized protein n=1 Tax=Chelatococcus reniformis TaxID=1494448 RepID=A0A916UWC7_9HYPH|nr:hypothetical protein [Chelatococcus reniformis]GGC91637.1 hypothetical protein GCM10010994_56750 [Chelatococcus reniformis]
MNIAGSAFDRLDPDAGLPPAGGADLARDLRADMPWLSGQQIQTIVDRDRELRRRIDTFGHLSSLMWLLGTAGAAALILLTLRF